MAQAESVSSAIRPLIPGAHSKRNANPACEAHKQLVVTLQGYPPRPISVDADSIDLEHRADHLNAVFSGLARYLAVILSDTAQNVPGGLDLTDAEAILADLVSDLTGAIRLAADGLAWRVE